MLSSDSQMTEVTCGGCARVCRDQARSPLACRSSSYLSSTETSGKPPTPDRKSGVSSLLCRTQHGLIGMFCVMPMIGVVTGSCVDSPGDCVLLSTGHCRSLCRRAFDIVFEFAISSCVGRAPIPDYPSSPVNQRSLSRKTFQCGET